MLKEEAIVWGDEGDQVGEERLLCVSSVVIGCACGGPRERKRERESECECDYMRVMEGLKRKRKDIEFWGKIYNEIN